MLHHIPIQDATEPVVLHLDRKETDKAFWRPGFFNWAKKNYPESFCPDCGGYILELEPPGLDEQAERGRRRPMNPEARVEVYAALRFAQSPGMNAVLTAKSQETGKLEPPSYVLCARRGEDGRHRHPERRSRVRLHRRRDERAMRAHAVEARRGRVDDGAAALDQSRSLPR